MRHSDYGLSDASFGPWVPFKGVALLSLVGLLFVFSEHYRSAHRFGLFGGNAVPWAGGLILGALLCCMLGFVHFFSVPNQVRHLLTGWPGGALRQVPWSRLACLVSSGLCLGFVGASWLLLPFMALLFAAISWSRRGPDFTKRFHLAGTSLWDCRAVWLVALFAEPLWPRSAITMLPEIKAAAVFCLVLSLVYQPYPRISFAHSFFVAKVTAQVSYERQLWLARLERGAAVCALLLGYSSLSLSSWCLWGMGRLLCLFWLEGLASKAAWKPVLRSEFGPFIDGKSKVLPDRTSLDDHHGPRSTALIPKDCVGDGELFQFAEVQPKKVTVGSKAVPIEAVLALLLTTLFLAQGFFSAAFSPSPLNFQTRVFDDTLLTIASTPDNLLLVESLGLPVQPLSAESSSITWTLILLSVFTGVLARWRGQFLGMWGYLSVTPSWPLVNCTRSITLAVAFAALVGWLWFPPKAAILIALFHFVITREDDGRAYCSSLQSLRLSILKIVRKPQKKKTLHESNANLRKLASVRPFSLQIGSGLVPLVTKNGPLKRRLTAARDAYHELLGLRLPAISIKEDLDLEPLEWRILHNGVTVGRKTIAEVSGKTSQLVAEDFLIHVRPFLKNLINSQFVSDYMMSALVKHPKKARKVTERYRQRELKSIFRDLFDQGVKLGDVESVLKRLVKSDQAFSNCELAHN